jgi:hypothetical protein
MKMQQQYAMKAFSQNMKDDIKESASALVTPLGGEHHHDGTSKPESKSHHDQETMTARQPTDDLLKAPTCPSLLLMEEDVGEIDIDDGEYEEHEDDSVGFHPVDTAGIFRAKPQPGLLKTFNMGSSSIDVTSCCEVLQVTNSSHSSFSGSLAADWQEGDSSFYPPSDIPSIIVLYTTNTRTTTTTSAFALVSPSPSRPDSASESTMTTTTSTLLGLSGSKRGLLDDTLFGVPRQERERKRRKKVGSLPRLPKPEEEQDEGNALNMAASPGRSSGVEELLAGGDPGTGHDHHHHPPSLLEVAVGYGYHLARCRMMNMMNKNEDSSKAAAAAELSGVLDPSRRVHEILEHGAQTIVRMKDQERLLFWKYMQSESLPSPTTLS